MSNNYVGLVVQVAIASNGEKGLVALHDSFTKIAFISNRWMQKAAKCNQPKVGEEWNCLIVHDTLMSEPKRGALILEPMRKVCKETVWTIYNEVVKKGERVVLIQTVRLGKQILNIQKYYIKSEEHIPSECPSEKKVDVRKRLDEIRYRQLRCSVSVSCIDDKQIVNVSLLSNPASQELNSVTLQSAEEIQDSWPTQLQNEIRKEFRRIEQLAEEARLMAQLEEEERVRKENARLRKVEAARLKAQQKRQQELEVRLAKEAADRERAEFELRFKNGKPVTVVSVEVSVTKRITDYWKRRPVAVKVTTRVLTLSNGKTLHTSSLDGSSDPYELKYLAGLDLPLNPVFTCAEVFALAEGAVVGYEYPFQWVDGWLTNGVMGFPRTRPEGSEWRDYPIKAIPKDCWELFLSGLEGKFAADFLPWHEQVTTREKKERVVRLTPRQKALQAIIRKQLWKGNEGDYVVIGTNLIFSHESASGSMLYLVDNPGVGAIYVFSDKKKAEELASNAVTRTLGIKRGYQRIIHRDGWEEKVEALLSGKVVLAENPAPLTLIQASGS